MGRTSDSVTRRGRGESRDDKQRFSDQGCTKTREEDDSKKFTCKRCISRHIKSLQITFNTCVGLMLWIMG